MPGRRLSCAFQCTPAEALSPGRRRAGTALGAFPQEMAGERDGVPVDRRSGFSLVEALWAAFLGSALLVLILVSTTRLQTHFNDLTRTLEGEGNVRQAPLLLYRLASPAGCRWSAGLDVAPDGTVSIRADIDGNAGFPDGSLDSSFERIDIRKKDDAIQVRSGAGTFQPVFRYISEFHPESPRPDRLDIRLGGGLMDPALSESFQKELAFSFLLTLWNRTDTLFLRGEPTP